MLTVFVREFLAGLLAVLMGVAPAAQVAPQPAEEQSYVQEIEDVSPARTLSATAGTLSLDVDSPVGSLPKAAKASLSKVSKAKLNKIRKEAAALLGTEIIDAVAFDISFLNNGIEIEPDGKVNITVNFPAIAEAPSYTIIHFRDDGTTEIVPGNVTATSATFEADNFSVYAVVGTPEILVPRVILEFYNYDGSTLIERMYVKKSDTAAEVEKIVYDPGAGTLPSGQVFKGWTEDKNYTLPVFDSNGVQTGGSTLLSISQIRTAAMTKASGFVDGDENAKDETIIYYAAIFKQYEISYIDEKGVSLGRHAAETPARMDTASYTVNMGYTTDGAHNFIGWLVADGLSNIVSATGISNITADTVFPNSTNITVKGNIKFSVIAPEGHWLVFHENGKGGTYNAPMFVKAGDVTAEPSLTMTRNGYTFDDWYYGSDDGNGNITLGDKFVFGGTLDDTTHIYANWKANTSAGYTIIFWTQNVSRTGYDVKASKRVTNGEVGSYIPYEVNDNQDEDYVTIDETDYHYIGFCLKESDKNQQVTITPEGDAVLNLHYDRIVYNLRFYLYRKGSENNSYQYAQNSNSGNNVWGIATWYSGTNINDMPTQSYQPTIQSEEVDGYIGYFISLSAYYGENIIAKWPSYTQINGPANNRQPVSFIMMVGAGLKPSPSNGGDSTIKGEVSVMDENILGKTNDANGNFLIVRFNTYNSWTYHIYYEAASGQDLTGKQTKVLNGKTYYLDHNVSSRSSNTDPAQQNPPQYQGFETVKDGDRAYYLLNSTCDLDYYYDRLDYSISYFDGTYFGGKDNKVVLYNHSATLFKESPEIGFGIAIAEEYSSYKPTAPNEDGFVFGGWYTDEGCTAPYVFGTMQIGGIKVYAKWQQIQYRVFLHPNADNDTTLDWGSSDQAMTFRVSFGDKVSAPTGTRTRYEFYGWYTDEECTQAFNADAFILNETTVTEDYYKTEFTDVMDKWGNVSGDATHPGPWNSDAIGYNGGDRYWITKQLNLYGLWSEITIGADGIGVFYDANGGSNAPTDTALYKDNSNVCTGGAATAPAGKVFDCWVLQTWNGSDYVDTTTFLYPGDIFKVLVANSKIVDKATNQVVLLANVEVGNFYTYTVQLKAIYKEKEEPTPTHIIWYSNFGTANGGKGTEYRYDRKDAQGNDTLKINEAVDIYGLGSGESIPTREFYVFKGWTKTKGGTTADFLIWDATNGQYKTDSGKVVTHVAADEKQPYDDLYAVWEKAGSIQIYHSGVAGGAIETVWLADIAEKGITAFDFTKELKSDSNEVLYKGITSGTLYGGYYLENENAETPNFVKPTDNAAYDGTNWTWKTAQTQAFTWTSETLKNLNGTVIYIKEVPADYMKPYTHIGFYGNKVSSILLVTAVDDLKYSAAGFKVTVGNGTTKTIGATSFRQSITIKAGDTTTGPHTATSLYSALKGGYLGYTMLSGSDYLTQNSVIKVTQYWVTPDGVTVEGTVIRTINIGDGTTDGANKISCSDAAYPVVTNEG